MFGKGEGQMDHDTKDALYIVSGQFNLTLVNKCGLCYSVLL